MTRRMAELKTKCSNMKLGPHGVEWVGELPAVLDLLLSAHAAFSRLSLLLRSRGKGEEIQDVVSGCLDILTLLGYSFSMDFSGVLEKKVAETQAVPKMLFFFNATTDDLNKKNAAAILAYFTKGAPLSAECVAIVPVLAEKCAFWCNRISSPTIPLLGYKLLLSAVYVVCLTPDGATRMVDAKIINPLLSVIAASKPPPEFTEMPSMIIATICQNTAHSPAHVKKLVKASLYPVVVKAMGVAFVDNQHKELYQYMLAMECMLRGGGPAVEAAVGEGGVGLLLTMLGGFAKWNSMHGVPDPRTVVLAAHMLLCVARHGAKGRERGRGRGKEDDDVVTDTEEKTQKTEITLLKRTGTGMGIDIGTGTETGAGTNVYKALFEAGKYRSVFASLRASYYCMSVSLISGELEQCINSCIGFLE